MSSPGQSEQVNEFRGRSGAECEPFIKSIRKAAWKEGKLQDGLWMANFASLHFSGKGFKWHSDLPSDVKQDWGKLEKALLEHWPPPAYESDNEEADAAAIPAPAAASLPSTQVGKSSDIGVLQFVPISEDQESMYISKLIFEGECKLTKGVEEALRVRWDGSVDSGFGVLERLEDSGRKWLAIHWTHEKPRFTQGSAAWARLTVVGPDAWTPATSRSGQDPRALRPFRIKFWKLSSEGQITPVWKDGVEEIQLEVFSNGGYVYLAVDTDTYQKANPNESHGRLVFRPIE